MQRRPADRTDASSSTITLAVLNFFPRRSPARACGSSRPQDPEEGLDIVFREHPDIVLTDLVMPGITGLEVLERVVEFDPAIDVDPDDRALHQRIGRRGHPQRARPIT